MRIRGKGLPALEGYGYGVGDIIVTTNIYVPQTLTKDEKEAFEKMRESDNMKPESSTKESFFSKFKRQFE